MEIPKLLVNLYLRITMVFMKHIASDIRQRLPSSTKLPHPTGIVIAGGWEIGENVQINQNVTLGTTPGEGYPVIEDNVTIYANSVVIGGITIREGSTIGANSTVIDDVPPNSTVVGSPAEVV